MNKKLLIVCIVLILIIVGVYFLPNKKPAASPSATAVFACGNEKSIEAAFFNSLERKVDLKLSDGRALSLPQTISASGARYADKDETIIFWNKGDTAFLTENGAETYSNCIIPEPGQADWLMASSSANGFSFRYPEKISAEYIEAIDWPPQTQIINETFSCNEAGSETDRAGRTEPVAINGRIYCVAKIIEGAAGSEYAQYAYAFPQENKTAILTFTLRFPRCENYDQPRQQTCQNERQNFDINSLIDRIARTAFK